MTSKANILYIGNILSTYGLTKGVIETLGPQLESLGYIVCYAGDKRNVLNRIIQMLFRIYKNRKTVDFVLIDTYSTSAFWYAWMSAQLCRMLKIRYVPILHGGNIPDRLKRSKRASSSIFNYSHKNVAVSGYLKQAFDLASYPCLVIPNNISIAEYQYKRRVKLKPRLIWVRSFHKQYNPKLAADVIAMLSKIFPKVELCMVGPDKDGSMSDFKEYIRKIGIEKRVIITGILPKSEWHKLSEDYDIFINTTNVDNTPVSVIEAMALGLPVVSTNVGGLPFLIEDGHDGFLVSPNNSNQIVQKIKMLIENSELTGKIIANAYNKAEEWDWQVVKHKWVNILK